MSMVPIRGLTPDQLRPVELQPIDAPGEATPASGPDFAETLTGALGRASAAEKTADEAAQRFAAGDPQVGIHEVMIASEKASISVRYAVTLKNRVLEAYRDLMNTPL
jgi:flagellar hook-basal body complex protein FliE